MRKKTKSVEAAPESLTYVGPTIAGVAVRNVRYSPLPDELQTAITNYPYLQGLCVESSALPSALAQIQNKSGGVYNLYAKAAADAVNIQKGAV